MGLIALPPVDIQPARLSLRPKARGDRDDGVGFAATMRNRARPEDAQGSSSELRGWRRADHAGRGHAYGRADHSDKTASDEFLPVGGAEEIAEEDEAADQEAVATAGSQTVVPLHTLPLVLLVAATETPPPIPIPPGLDAPVAGPLTAGATQAAALSVAPVITEGDGEQAPPSAGPTADTVATSADPAGIRPLEPSEQPPLTPHADVTTDAQTSDLAILSPAPNDTPGPGSDTGEPIEAPAPRAKLAGAPSDQLVQPTVSRAGSADQPQPQPPVSAALSSNVPGERDVPKPSPQGIAHAADASAVAALRPPSTDAPGPVEAAPSLAQPADLPDPVQQVTQVVVEAIEQGGGEARLHLKPAELGEVVIRLRIEGTEVRLQVQTERPEAMQLLREHRLDLTNLLGDRGLDLSELYVGLGGRDASEAQRQQETPANNRPRGSSEFANLLGFDPEAATANVHRLRAAYNPDGVHVYRI